MASHIGHGVGCLKTTRLVSPLPLEGRQANAKFITSMYGFWCHHSRKLGSVERHSVSPTVLADYIIHVANDTGFCGHQDLIIPGAKTWCQKHEAGLCAVFQTSICLMRAWNPVYGTGPSLSMWRSPTPRTAYFTSSVVSSTHRP
jgi:hypothetical protein